MRPVRSIPAVGDLREITMWKAIVLSIVTFGIYYLVITYQNSNDLQRTRPNDSSMWMVWFWLGILTAGLLWIVLFVQNGMAYAELRRKVGLPDSPVWIVALVLSFVLPPVGDIIWAVHFNDGIRAAASGTGAPSPPTPQAQAA